MTGKGSAAEPKRLLARTWNSGFDLAHDSYNSISAASDGRIYYVLSSEMVDTGAMLFSFDPAAELVEALGDLTEACGEKDLKAIPQGKSHVNFVESDGKLYFSTHIGYYSIADGMETMGVPPAGYKPYPGGHLLALDLKTKRVKALAIEPHGEGIITMNMDPMRGRIYGLTWPTGYFFWYDLSKREWKDLGPVAQKGESGTGTEYQTICRSLAIDPRDGSVYFTNSFGDIRCYNYGEDSLEDVTEDNMRKDYFGSYDPHSPGHMGYNWRQTIWDAESNSVYGVHGNSGYLFRFDPASSRVDILERITSEPSKRSGMFDQFSYGYLGFGLGPDSRTLHYLTGGPIYENGRRVKGKDSTAKGESKGVENLHFITYDLRTSHYEDHGPIFFSSGDRPMYVNSIAVGQDGTVYALTRITENGRTRTDLMSIPAPRM